MRPWTGLRQWTHFVYRAGMESLAPNLLVFHVASAAFLGQGVASGINRVTWLGAPGIAAKFLQGEQHEQMKMWKRFTSLRVILLQGPC